MSKLSARTHRTTSSPAAGGAVCTNVYSPSSVAASVLLSQSIKSSSSQMEKDENENHCTQYDKLVRQRQQHKYSPRAFQRLWYRWQRLTKSYKIVTTLLGLFFLQNVLLGIWDYSFSSVGITVQDKYDNNNKNSSQVEFFSVVINTYKRPDMIRQAVQHYADKCGRRYKVGQVFVVWAEQGVQVPTEDFFFDDNPSLRKRAASDHSPPLRANVQVLQVSKDSLNSRFEPIPALQTTCVFMVDDDIRVACPSLLLGFQAWKATPDSMVGYYPRLASPPISETDNLAWSDHPILVYHTWPIVYWRNKMNFVLTKASFLHSKYLELYTSDDTFPKEIKDHVDKHMNCEDIAMSMLVANYTRYHQSLRTTASSNVEDAIPARPIYVQGRVSDLGLFGGISTGAGHMTTRSDCLTQLTAILLSQGWNVPPLQHAFDLSESSYLHHSPGEWWQNRPSNVFEWFAFANTFT